MKHKFFQLTAKSFDELGVATHQELWEKVKSEGYTAFQLGIKTILTKADDTDEDKNLFHAVLSDSLEDRHGDIVVQEWVLGPFKKNAVLLDSHDYSTIEAIIGRWTKIEVAEKKLQGDIEFALENPRGLLAYNLAKGGFLTALSAGFIPLEFDDKGRITKSELLEGSMVSVPANPRTLIDKSVEPEQPAAKGDAETAPAEHQPTEKAAPATKSESVVHALSKRLARNEAVLRAVAKELSSANSTNIEARKRSIWKSLRQAL